jgi:hypothetical protein
MSIANLQANRVITIGGISFETKVATFNYYESVLSPFITANLTYADTGNSAIDPFDIQERTGTLRDSVIRGSDRSVQFKFENIMGSIDFQGRKFLEIDDSVILSSDSTTEYGALRLVSPTYKLNYENNVFEKFYGQISNSVKKIVTEKLNMSTEELDIENSSNPKSFTGSNREPYDIITHLASLSTRVGGLPGFFAYETKSGFHFRSIDSLMDQTPVNQNNPYFHTDVFKSDLISNKNAYKIIGTPTKKDPSVSKLIQSGAYFAEFRFMYEDEQTVKSKFYRIESDGRFESIENPTNNTTRLYTMSIPRGMNDSKVSKELESDPSDILAKSVMRYNILMSQAINILIPCNPSLEAGNLIRCQFEKVTSSSKVLGPSNVGNYLILNLCHQFNGTDSYTSLTIVRDTYGNQKGIG